MVPIKKSDKKDGFKVDDKTVYAFLKSLKDKMEPFVAKDVHPIKLFELILEKQRHLIFLNQNDEKEDARMFKDLKKVIFKIPHTV